MVGSDEDSDKIITYYFGKTAATAPSFDAAIFDNFIGRLIAIDKEFGAQASYVPAARTGLILAHRQILSGLIDTLGINQAAPSKGTLPLPIIRFLQLLTNKNPARPNSRLLRIARDIEDNVLLGAVRASRGSSPEFTYHPEGMEDGLPLHVTSSMVTELAPFLLLLKSGIGSAGLVFEEPEAHLHLSAQRQMARAIARLVNVGIPVVVTTHSDAFVQQLNNLMHLACHPKKKELCKAFSYAEDELIHEGLARAYEFVEIEGGTAVRELDRKLEGFAVESLNETLSEMTIETLRIQK